MSRRAAGFTLIEMMIVVVILSILAGILLPKTRDFRRRAIAAKAVGAMSVARTAAYQYNEATGGWPPSAGRGQVPAGLATYLPAGFSFAVPEFDLMWRVQNIRSGGTTTTQQMIQVLPQNDPVLCAEIGNQLGGGRNPSLVVACGGRNGSVTLYVER
jgi:prepilin-type N-terminal cleavage/methylation domain-containing protein